MEQRPLALVVAANPAVRARIHDVLERRGALALGAGSGAEAIELLRRGPIVLVLADPRAPGVAAEGLLERALHLDRAPVLVLLGAADGSSDALRSEAFDVVPEALDDAALEATVARALRHAALAAEAHGLRRELQRREGFHGLVGRSPAMERVREQIERLAASDTPVWIVGESGTGRHHVARSLHERSGRPDHTFHVADAERPAAGGPAEWLLRAAGGTLYVEHLSRLNAEAHEEWLRALGREDRGETRVVVSSERPPHELVEEGRIGSELAQRLAGEVVALPPLRERGEDVALLARHFVGSVCEINRLPPLDLAPPTVALLERQRWPDNVRELRNAMEQAVILATDGVIRPRDLPDRMRQADPGGAPATAAAGGRSTRPFREAKREVVEAFERSYLADLLRRHAGNVTAAAEHSGMLRSALQRLLRKYGLRSAEFRGASRSAEEGPEAG